MATIRVRNELSYGPPVREYITAQLVEAPVIPHWKIIMLYDNIESYWIIYTIPLPYFSAKGVGSLYLFFLTRPSI